MKAFYDTSVLLPVFYADHPRHAESSAIFRAHDKRNAGCAAHCAAELYATLTRLPVRPRIAADQAILFIESLQKRATLVSLDGEEYCKMLIEVSRQRLSGGVVYDAVIAACARKCRAGVLYTWNPSDFERLHLDDGPVIRTPAGR